MAGLTWPEAAVLDQTTLERALFPPTVHIPESERPLPEWSTVQLELKRNASVTQYLLWHEYKLQHPEKGYQYSQFCNLYRAWLGKVDVVMRQEHRAGEKLFVDYAGQTVEIIDRQTGEVKTAQIFVSVLGASSYAYAEATWTQGLSDWIGSHVRALEYFGGVPEVVVPDNLRSAVTKAHRYEPDLNPTYQDLAQHYSMAIVPARVRKPRDKGRIERAIRYIRDNFWPARQWTDLDDLNAQAKVWCEGATMNRPCPEDRTKTVGEAFIEEQPRLMPLPETPYPTDEQIEVKVGKTPYVRFDKNDYSVPHTHVRTTLLVVASEVQVRVMDGGDLIATHPRSYDKGEQIEDPAHIEALIERKRAAHQHSGQDRLAHAAPSSKKLLLQAAQRGDNLGSITAALLRALDDYGAQALEMAVTESLSRGVAHPNGVRQALERQREEKQQPPPVSITIPDHPELQKMVVRPHELADYDQLQSDVRQKEGSQKEALQGEERPEEEQGPEEKQ